MRIDPYLDTLVHVVGSRQGRPNRPGTAGGDGCPFCPGGLEAPEPYDVRWFENRWPAMPGGRCDVVLYTSQHDATLWSLGRSGVRKVIDLWTERTTELARRDDVDYVLVFENRGAEVGATIPHPHGQIYAYDHVPDRPRRLLAAGWQPDPDPRERLIAEQPGWCAYVPFAPTYPLEVVLAPSTAIPDLEALDDRGRDAFADLLVDVFARLDRLFECPLPYMMWLMQRPTTANAALDHPAAWFHAQIVSPWRAAGVQRFIAAAEVACDEYFNPVDPEQLAARLRG